MAQATAMKRLPHVSRMEHVVNEARVIMKHVCEIGQDAHVSIKFDHWIPFSPDDTKMMMLLLDTDPKLRKQAMASYDAAEWVEDLRKEMASLWAHNVFTLILKLSVPGGHWIVKLRPHCHRKHNEKGEFV